MTVTALRVCDRCGETERPMRQLITLGELLDCPVPLDLQDYGDDPLWCRAYCRSRDCVGVALTQLGRLKLAGKRLHGRGIKRERENTVVTLARVRAGMWA